MMNEQLEEQASLYALELLEGDEKPAFETRLASDAELQDCVDRLRESAALLAHGAPLRPLPAPLEATIMRAIRAEVAPAPRSSGSNWLPWAIAACLTLACGLLLAERARLATRFAHAAEQSAAAQSRVVAVTAERDEAREEIAQLEERESAARTSLAKLGQDRDDLKKEIAQLEKRDPLAEVQVVSLSSKFETAPNATATVIWDGEKQRGLLRTADVPANASDEDYQLWIVDPEYKLPVSAAVFHVSEGGVSKIAFKPKARVTSANAFAVSLEHKGGAAKAEGPMVLVGK